MGAWPVKAHAELLSRLRDSVPPSKRLWLITPQQLPIPPFCLSDVRLDAAFFKFTVLVTGCQGPPGPPLQLRNELPERERSWEFSGPHLAASSVPYQRRPSGKADLPMPTGATHTSQGAQDLQGENSQRRSWSGAFQSQRVTTDNLLHFQRETRRERKIDDWRTGGGGGGKIFATSEHMTTFPRPQSSQGARLGPKKDGSLLGCITQERFFKLLQSRVGGWEYLAHSHSPSPTMLIL